MKIIVSSNNEYLASLQSEADNITGGSVVINDKTYEVKTEEVSEIPEDAADCQFIFENGSLVENPDYFSDDVTTRLNDIEQILIDLLDTI